MSRSVCSNTIPVLVIFAPTACGKTAAVSRLFSDNSSSPFSQKAEIINADSMQVYKGLNIGTAKPDPSFLSHLPHHLIDIVSPKEQFGTGEFVRLADAAAEDIYSRGKLPVVCGGTAFYIRNFLYGLPVTPEADPLIRKNLQARLAAEGGEALRRELEGIDPESASKINQNDDYRVVRALEVYYSSGKPLSFYELPSTFRSGYSFCILNLERPREELYERINKRVELMFSQGLVDEVKNLLASGVSPSDPGMQAIGYREFFMSGSGFPHSYTEADIEYFNRLIQRDSRHYAKRQLTFFKPIKEAVCIPADSFNSMEDKIGQFFNQFT